jgi:outer membrane protein assembly factor BamB
MMSHWGYSESPLVDGDRLICTPGAPDAAMAALDKKTGRVLWKAGLPEPGQQGRDGAGYSSIVVSEACGVRQYVQLTGRGLISVSAKDGTFLWSYHRIANRTANISTPLIDGDYVFCSTGYGTGAALLHLVPDGAGVKAEEVYFLNAKQMQNHHGGMVRVGEHIYCGHGHNQGFPLCIEMKTGKVAWRGGRGPGRGSAAVLHAEGRLYFRYQDGVMALIETTPDEYRLKGSFTIASNNGKHWPHPVIAGKRLYLRDQDTLLCYNIARN